MPPSKQKIANILKALPSLSDSQILWIEGVIQIFACPHKFIKYDSDLINDQILKDFGDVLRIHHSFSREPFTKDKFEYALEKVLTHQGIEAKLAHKGNRGHDLTINNKTFSLKTPADRNINENYIWISKFMELGKGVWGDKDGDLIGLRNAFIAHMNNYDRILILRSLGKNPHWKYELIEAPKKILLLAKKGELKMMHDSKQYPKPGYCFVNDPKSGEEIFKLYFDGGRENKLQIKNLKKTFCKIHAYWEFDVPKAQA
jgi:type II restriction enzyme